MGVAHLQAMEKLEEQAFTYFDTPRPCAVCGIPIVAHREQHGLVWTLVHGEQPIMSWLDSSLGDELDQRQFRRDLADAVALSHWERYSWSISRRRS